MGLTVLTLAQAKYASAAFNPKEDTEENLAIDPFHKWLPIINSLVIIKVSLTNLVFELIIQKNFYSQTSLVRLI